MIEFLGNTIEEYLIALGAFVVFWIVLRFLQKGILSRLAKLSKETETDLDDTFIRIFQSIKPTFYTYLSFYLATLFLNINSSVQSWLGTILLILVVYQVIKSMQALIDYIIEKKTKAENKDEENAFKFLGNLFKWSLWIVGLILVLSNLGFNVNSLIAGLGIGGIAIAMAVQGVLQDLFSAFSIYFDKPFVVGDTIKVGNDIGTVEKIGIKTTRLRSLSSNEELVISNTELTSARVQNFKKINERRVSLTLGVLYGTPNEKMKKIPEMVKRIVNGVEKARFDRAHFSTFNASSLDFDVIYFIESDDYVRYMEAQQEINLELKGEFEKEGIGMAYPTQTIYLNK
jgi:small-conductance mechanosensitive channel